MHRNFRPTQGLICAPSLFLKETETVVSVGAHLAVQGDVFFKSEKTSANSVFPDVSACFQLQPQSLE